MMKDIKEIKTLLHGLIPQLGNNRIRDTIGG